MCFKHGRVTIPPKIALAVAGFSLTEGTLLFTLKDKNLLANGRIACLVGSKNNWERASEIRARGAGAMGKYLRGGWKESERWWEPSVEVDAERERRIEVLSTLMRGMDGLRMQ